MTTPQQTNAYLVKIVTRAPSSGSEHWDEHVFLSLDGASKYLQSEFQNMAQEANYPEDWDTDDMDGEEFPSPDIFSVENLTKRLENNKKMIYDFPIWGPESAYQAQRPIEFSIKSILIHS